MLKEQKEASEALAEVEKLKKKLVRLALKTLGPFMRYTQKSYTTAPPCRSVLNPSTQPDSVAGARTAESTVCPVPFCDVRASVPAEGAAVRGCEPRGRKCVI
jgi:hypothetical protein